MFHERERFLFENILAEQICCGIHNNNNKCINNLLLNNKVTCKHEQGWFYSKLISLWQLSIESEIGKLTYSLQTRGNCRCRSSGGRSRNRNSACPRSPDTWHWTRTRSTNRWERVRDCPRGGRARTRSPKIVWTSSSICTRTRSPRWSPLLTCRQNSCSPTRNRRTRWNWAPCTRTPGSSRRRWSCCSTEYRTRRLSSDTWSAREKVGGN